MITFKIVSTLENGEEYLLYSSNQWKAEELNSKVALPKISLKSNSKSIDIMSIINSNFAPVAIYQTNISTNQNYDTSGTH